MDSWLAGYEHQPVAGAGLAVGPGGDKIVLHTTESGPGSLQGLIGHWQSNWGSGLPHFIAEGSRFVQLLPLTSNAYTLENKAGGADTNRAGHVIQVEIVGFAADEFNNEQYEALGKWVADLMKAGLNIDLDACPRFYGANEGVVLASYSSPIRFGAEAWTAARTIVGHQHAPENAHWDPGHLDIHRVCDIARRHLGTSDWSDMATKDEIKDALREVLAERPDSVLATYTGASGQKAIYECFLATGICHHLSPEGVAADNYLHVKNLGEQGVSFWSRFTPVEGTWAA